jgi:hypothetical protein
MGKRVQYSSAADFNIHPQTKRAHFKSSQQTDAHKSNDSQINLQNNSIHIPKKCFKDGHELRERDSQSSQKEKLVKFGNRCLLKRLHLAMDLQKTASREPRNLTIHLSHLHPLWAGEMGVQDEPMNFVTVGNVEAAI